jgi:SAM-dependent methyltransferase
MAAPTATLYERLPYPADGVVRSTTARILERGLARHFPHLSARRHPVIADIGCGTGEHTCGLARHYPEATVVGVDINQPSLELAENLAQTNGLDLRFLRADITGNLAASLAALPELGCGRKADILTSMGVLHHLARPVDGFRALRQCIAADGAFLCYIYSKCGRWADIAVRHLLDRTLPADDLEERYRTVTQLQLSDRHTVIGSLKRLLARHRYGPPFSVGEFLQLWIRRTPIHHVSDSYSCPCETYYAFGELREMAESAGWRIVALAPDGGLPTRPEEFTGNRERLACLRAMPEEVLYDYFAFRLEAPGFTLFLRPA